jgi:arginyl-tRNA synthetase
VTPDQLAQAIQDAAQAAVSDYGAAATAVQVSVERPRRPEHGDYASSIALQLARLIGVPPQELAMAIAVRLRADPAIDSAQVAPPGFLNVRLNAAATGALAGTVVEQGPRYGHGASLRGQRLNLEFVSSNPTGPIHLGGTRWAAVGDALAQLLRAQGATVATEYYFNDAGAQIDRFAASLLAAARGGPAPEDGYAGDYIGEIAAAVVHDHPGLLGRPEPEAIATLRAEGVALMFGEIKTSLAGFGVEFDVYFAERDLHTSGELDAALARLRQLGHVYLADGATWVRTSDFGDDKDRVYVRSTGEFTYFAADCAYYLNKRGRGFDKAVIMLGADHHGYIGRLRAVAACLGDDPDQTLEILIGQLVSLVEDGVPVRMSKRAGTMVTLEDLVGALGVDAARYALARYSTDSPIDLDLGLWTRQRNDNLVYYVQYAHARIASLLRHAAAAGLTRGDR